MDLRGFHNRLRIMIGIDRDELEVAGVIAQDDHNAWDTFHQDPFRWLIRCDDESAEKLWALIQRRAGSQSSQANLRVAVAIAYDPEQAAAVTGRSRSRIFLAIKNKEITARKEGGATLIEDSELRRWISSMPTIGRSPS